MTIENKKEKLLELSARALHIRIDSIRSTTASASGHPTTCMSAAEILSVLFFDSMNIDVCHPKDKNNDRFVLSKGHGVPAVYAVYKQLGVISDEDLMKLRDIDSTLEGHPTRRFIFNEAATGSLGQGLAIGAGIAFNANHDGLSYKTYVLLGDGELAEGSIWEAAEFASFYKLSNLICIADCNRLGQTGETLYGHDVEVYERRFKAFGFNTILIDGHDIEQILKSVEEAKGCEDKPTMIIAKTLKGYGVDALEDKNSFHGKPVSADDLDKVLENLKNRFTEEHNYFDEKILKIQSECTLKKVEPIVDVRPAFSLDLETAKNRELFEKGNKLATRKAFGYGLAALGRVSEDIFVLDGDVKNSTYTQFFDDEFPERFIQCFIAEQTMIGVATGLESRGKIPFAATFGAFFTRAHDQIRMAGVGRNALRLCGSHCGVSIGEDGPSQMGLEDMAMMRAIPGSVVLYPSDAVCAYKLVEYMANYHDGISYMRTTRSDTPILYDLDEEFEIGGCKVLRQSKKDRACIVAAGITLHEALKAYEALKEKNIFISVIDAYSVKPLDVNTIRDVAKSSGNRVVVVEDHYVEGGLGEAVASALGGDDEIVVELLGVREVPRSGKTIDLLRLAGIDSDYVINSRQS